MGNSSLCTADSIPATAIDRIDSFVLLFPNDEWSDSSTDADLDHIVARLRPEISYAQIITDNLRTLSTHNADPSGQISGFLYVPDLNQNDPCQNVSIDYIPGNVTRRANLPPTDFTLIAIAPWINAECTQSFLASARADLARGFLFFQPDNGTDQPPPVSSPVWGLHDGGRWKMETDFPVYAVPGSTGAHMLYESSLYSGNLTDIPFGHDISELPGIDPRDYVRIYTELGLSSSSSLPSVWVFLLIIGAFLALLLSSTSGLMHLIQRRRRHSLRRRVESGQVDLEALGIKRLKVPLEVIERLPVYTYYSEHDSVSAGLPDLAKQDSASAVESNLNIRPSSPGSMEDKITSARALSQQSWPQTATDGAKSSDPILAHRFLPYSQPTCPICLDEFQSGSTPIRELPCGHIYHPECIDSFLSNNSSLCPMCKKTVLPVGYCPTKITNIMVRRERNLRRLRSRITVPDNDTETGGSTVRSQLQNWGSRISRRVLRQPEPVVLASTSTGMELQFQPQEASGRQTYIGDAATEVRQPGWRRAISRVFPGF
ncbi:hypothetical protein B7463_g10591, partial [Scytalidium lignicola]